MAVRDTRTVVGLGIGAEVFEWNFRSVKSYIGIIFGGFGLSFRYKKPMGRQIGSALLF